ncbi:MAG: hypothetical protein HQ402_04060 [Parcubacteria group bacterium]|nr:hypothetical protein [Parcubacteria group bacterium]
MARQSIDDAFAGRRSSGIESRCEHPLVKGVRCSRGNSRRTQAMLEERKTSKS